MKAAPILKPKIKEKGILIELPEDSGVIYQAIGILPGEVTFEDEKAFIKVKEKTYPLYSGYSRDTSKTGHDIKKRFQRRGERV